MADHDVSTNHSDEVESKDHHALRFVQISVTPDSDSGGRICSRGPEPGNAFVFADRGSCSRVLSVAMIDHFWDEGRQRFTGLDHLGEGNDLIVRCIDEMW